MNRIRRAIPSALVVLAALFAILGLGDVLVGIAFEPTTAVALTGKTVEQLRRESDAAYTVLDYLYRTHGITLASFGALMTIVLVIPYRRGERWAWAAAWILPAWSATVFLLAAVHGSAPGQPISAVAWSGAGFAVVTAALLLIDLGRFRTTAAEPLAAPSAA